MRRVFTNSVGRMQKYIKEKKATECLSENREQIFFFSNCRFKDFLIVFYFLFPIPTLKTIFKITKKFSSVFLALIFHLSL